MSDLFHWFAANWIPFLGVGGLVYILGYLAYYTDPGNLSESGMDPDGIDELSLYDEFQNSRMKFAMREAREAAIAECTKIATAFGVDTEVIYSMKQLLNESREPAKFFSYSDEEGMTIFETETDARMHGAFMLEEATKNSAFVGEWVDYVESICWGAVSQHTVEIPDEETDTSDFVLSPGPNPT